jgi:RimJ/RimL family protein N-acetyltransferase
LRIVTLPACMRRDKIRLRPLRIFDGPFVRNMLNDEDIVKSCGGNKPASHSWFSVWWWIKKNFTPAYCIEYGSRPVGFTGVYHLTPGESAELSLVISDKRMRRRGYGSSAFALLWEVLQRHSFAREVSVRVWSDNPGAALFWKKLGFSEIKLEDGIVTMSRQLQTTPACQKEKREGHLIEEKRACSPVRSWPGRKK